MNPTARLAGLFAAHAVWCVSDEGPLIPMLSVEFSDGKTLSNRLMGDDLAEGIEMGKMFLETNHYNAQRAVLIYDGYVTLEFGKTDALLLDARDYADQARSFTMVIPYRSPDHPDGFAVFRPKFASFPGATGDADYQEAVASFFSGVDEHTEGAKVWNAHLDQTR